MEGLADRILRYGVKALLVKLGPRGIYLRTAPSNRWKKCGRGLEHLGEDWHDRQIWAPAFAVTEKSRTGAGDAAIAGFLAGILRGASPSKPCVWLLQLAPTALKRRVGWLNWRGGIKSVRELSVDGKPSRLI